MQKKKKKKISRDRLGAPFQLIEFDFVLLYHHSELETSKKGGQCIFQLKLSIFCIRQKIIV